MTTAILRSGRPLHFPGTFQTDDAGVIIAPPPSELELIAEQVRDDELLVFATRLVRVARKRRSKPRNALLNWARLYLARRCIDRALSNSLPA